MLFATPHAIVRGSRTLSLALLYLDRKVSLSLRAHHPPRAFHPLVKGWATDCVSQSRKGKRGFPTSLLFAAMIPVVMFLTCTHGHIAHVSGSGVDPPFSGHLSSNNVRSPPRVSPLPVHLDVRKQILKHKQSPSSRDLSQIG